jgi:hypothetical protein
LITTDSGISARLWVTRSQKSVSKVGNRQPTVRQTELMIGSYRIFWVQRELLAKE